MLKSTCKKALENIRAFILRNTDGEPYGIETPTDFPGCARFIMSAFYAEKVEHDKRNMNYQDLFEEWLSGLPTAFDAGYYYLHSASAVDILGDLLEESEAEKQRFTEEQACKHLSYLIYREVLKACGYQIKKFVEV